MLVAVLGWCVVVVPVLLTAIFVFIPERAREPLVHKRWRFGLIGIAIVYSLMVAWWMRQSTLETTKDRNDVIKQVSAQTTDNVTTSMGKQFGPIISDITKQNDYLSKQLGEQTKKMDAIGNSNIVSGKNPIPVTLTNIPPVPFAPEIHIARMPTTPDLHYGKHAVQFILTTTKIMEGARATVKCAHRINQGSATLAGAGAIIAGGGGLLDPFTYESGVGSPNWSPSLPLVITIYFDDDDLGTCTITPR